MPRPCPFVRCRHHLASDAHAGIYELRPRVSVVNEAPETMVETCALDVAERVGPRALSLFEIAELLGVQESEVAATFQSATARRFVDPKDLIP